MRVRVLLAVALALVAGTLVLDMSGRAPRLAGTDHTSPVGFVATLHSAQELCQPGMVLPSDAARVQVLVGTYGPPVPELSTRFLGTGGRALAEGRLPAGHRAAHGWEACRTAQSPMNPVSRSQSNAKVKIWRPWRLSPVPNEKLL